MTSRIAAGDTSLAAWQVESCVAVARLERLTGIPVWQLIDPKKGRVAPTQDALMAIATALRITPELLDGWSGPNSS